MTGKGPNGSTPVQNLVQMRSKPVFDKPAEPERSKCPFHPTKRMWTDPLEAIREAEARSEATRIAIVAMRCEGCHNIHLCKRENARAGTILERPHVEEPELPLVLGNGDARRKVLKQFLGDRTEVSTLEIVDLLGVDRKRIGAYMGELGWHNTRGRNARWVKPKATTEQEARDAGVQVRSTGTPPNFEVFDKQKARHLTAVEGAKSRHPAAQHVGWMPMENLNPIVHVPLGDVIAVLKAAGLELRLQTRER